MTTATIAATPAVELTAAERFTQAANDIISAVLKQNDAAKLRKLRPLMLELLDGATTEDAALRKLKVIKAFWESHPEMLECIKKVVRSKKNKDGKPKHDLSEGIFSVKAGVGFLQVDLYVQAVAEFRKECKPAASDTRKYDEWLLTNKQQGRKLRYWMDDINDSMNAILEEMGAKESSKGGGRGDKGSKGEVVEGTVVVSPETANQNLASILGTMNVEELKGVASILVATMYSKGMTVKEIEDAVIAALGVNYPAQPQPVAA